MELLEGIVTRRSCRAFKPIPISKEILERVLEAAKHSPSYTNTQPWEVAVISGSKKDELVNALHGMANSDIAAGPDLPLPTSWPPELEKRSKEHGARRFEALGIERDNTQQRKELRLSNFKFYGAPCVLFIFIDSNLTSWSILDAGLFAQSLILAAHSFGLGSCLQASTTGYPDKVRQILGIPNTKMLVIGIALGYPDIDAKINSYHSTRVELNEFIQWYQ